MTTLAAALSNSATEMRVNAAVADPAEFYQIDDEVIRVAAVTTTVNGSFSPAREVDDTLWQIAERGVGATAAASHLSGATLTPFPGVSGGGAVEGTVVVTPPSEVDIGAALEAAPTPPTAENPYVTLEDVGIQDRIEIRDNGVLRAAVWVTFGVGGGAVHLATYDDQEVLVNHIVMEDDKFLLTNADGSRALSLDADGSASISSDGAEYKISATGALTMRNADASGTVSVDTTGQIELSGPFALRLVTLGIFLDGLPTADPSIAGALWSDTGTVKVSAG